MIVVMNKVDKASVRTVGLRKREYRRIMDAQLRDALGQMVDEIAIMPCSVVSNPEGTKAVDSVLAYLAKAFSK